jgi:hypothetical protein
MGKYAVGGKVSRVEREPGAHLDKMNDPEAQLGSAKVEFGHPSPRRSTRSVSRRTPMPDSAGTPPIWMRPGKFAETVSAGKKERGSEQYSIEMLDGSVQSINGRIYDVPTDILVNIYTPIAQQRVWLGRAGNCSLITVGGEDEKSGGRADTYVVERHPAKDEVLKPRVYRKVIDDELKNFDLVSFPWIGLQKSTS